MACFVFRDLLSRQSIHRHLRPSGISGPASPEGVNSSSRVSESENKFDRRLYGECRWPLVRDMMRLVNLYYVSYLTALRSLGLPTAATIVTNVSPQTN